MRRVPCDHCAEKPHFERHPAQKLTNVLRSAHIHSDAPCGSIGKCRVLIDGTETLACQTMADRDMTVTIPESEKLYILQTGIPTSQQLLPGKEGCLPAFDIGTTSVVCFLLDGKTETELVFDAAVPLDPQTITAREDIRSMCAADKCGAYYYGEKTIAYPACLLF